MARNEVCAVTKGNTRICVYQDEKGRCFPKATGSISRELQAAIDQYQAISVNPTWLLSQLTKLIKD